MNFIIFIISLPIEWFLSLASFFYFSINLSMISDNILIRHDNIWLFMHIKA